MDDEQKIFLLVADLTSPDQREGALLELSKRREAFADLAPVLWHSFGTIAALLQEIIAIYPLLNPPSLTAHASNRVCNALALLQCVASHPETRTLFLNGKHVRARDLLRSAPARTAPLRSMHHRVTMHFLAPFFAARAQRTSRYFSILFSTPSPRRALLSIYASPRSA